MHESASNLLRFFEYSHLRPELQEVSKMFADLAHEVAHRLEGPEATVALRKLLEAKDAAVRAAL
jgi:hypothetical protein